MADTLRPDLQLIADLITADDRVLDIGCGTGELLAYLRDHRGIDGRGMELSQQGVNTCVEKGLFVVQGDADRDLSDFGDDRFDIVVLSKTLQAVDQPDHVLKELTRIGRRAIITIPNFGHWRVRLGFAFSGRMPETKALPVPWYQTQNVHLCTIKDMWDLIEKLNLAVTNFTPFSEAGDRLSYGSASANLLAPHALFQVQRRA